MEDERINHQIKLVSNFISEGKNLHAVQILKKLIEETEGEEFYYQLAELYGEMGFIDAGTKTLSELLQNNNSSDAVMYWGQYLLRNSKWFEAIEVLNKITDVKPPTIFLIGYAYMMLNEFELSREYFTKYNSTDDKSELKQEANLYLAKIEYELNNFDSALNYAKNAQFIYSDFWELNLILAKVYYSLGMFNHSVNPIMNALKLKSKERTVLEFAGKIYFQLQDYKKAAHYLSQCVEQSSEVSADIYTLLAKSFLKQRKREEANLFFELALKINPLYPPALAGKLEVNK